VHERTLTHEPEQSPMARHPLSDEQITQQLLEYPGWARHAARLTKTFRFKDFVEAFGWMTQVALIAEKMDHHPDWKNVYRTVEVELTTHDAGGLTQNDFDLAAAMDRLAG
jgi:4a-hydroxytetrahydrobiopterin dehydratase